MVPSPYNLKTEEEQLRSILLNPKASKYHKSIEMRLAQPLMVERRYVSSMYTSTGHTEDDKHQILIWMKAVGRLPDTPTVHQCVRTSNIGFT
jgi:acyl-CoA thioesterase